MGDGRTSARAARWSIGVLAIAIGALTAVCAVRAIAHQAPFSEYLEQARRCVELGDCPSRGGLTELGPIPLYHGASWIRLLAYSLRSGADLTRVQSVVLALWLLSIPAMLVLLQRYLGWRAATMGLGLYFPVVLVGTDIHLLTYTNLTPLPFALYFLAIALFVEFRSAAWAALASIALAGAVSAELGSIVMAPFHFALIVLVASRRALTFAVAALALAVPFCLDSMDAAREIVRQAPTLRFAAGVAISAALIGVAAGIGSKRLLRVPTAARVRAVMVAALVYPVLAVWLACLLLRHSWPLPSYFAPAGLPFVYLVAERSGGIGSRSLIGLLALEAFALLLLALAPQRLELLQVPSTAVVTLFALAVAIEPTAGRALGARWPVAGICVSAAVISIAVWVVRARRGSAQEFTLPEAEQVVARLYAAGYSYPQLVASLQGPSADDLTPLLTVRDPTIFTAPAPTLVGPDFSLLVAKVPETTAARAAEVVAAIPVGDGRLAAVIRTAPPYMDWLHMRRCGPAGGGGGTYGCASLAADAPLPHNWPYVPFGAPTPAHEISAAGTRTVIYEVPVHTPGQGRPHVVRLPNEWPATWRITRVTGVDFAGELPATEIRFPDRREASGSVQLEFTSPIPGDLPWIWRPHAVEVDARNDSVLGAPSAAP